VLAQASPPDETGYLLAPIPMDGLPLARTCAVTLPEFGHYKGEYMPAHGTMIVSNDGGWCRLQFAQDLRGLVFVPNVRVTQEPAHGTVVAKKMQGRIGLAYRPVAGFTGSDHFAVGTNGPLPHTIPITVTVQ
jgi:hypothetical protein